MQSKYEDGIYKDLSNEAYHADCRLSRSGLAKLLSCPAKFYHEYLNEFATDVDTPAMAMGRAVHTAVLEPEKFSEQFISYEKEFNGTSKEGRALKSANPGKHIFSYSDMEIIRGVNQSVRLDPVFQYFVDVNDNAKRGLVECSLMYSVPDLPVQLRSRPDFFNDEVVIDLKTCKSATLEEFERSVKIYHYDMQAAMMQDALLALTGKVYTNFLFLCVEKEAPFVCSSFLLKGEAIEIGRQRYYKAVKRFIECTEKNQWPGYYESVQMAGFTNWDLKRMQDEEL